MSGKKLPNPLLDIPMAYLQTNTHLESLEVVERVDKAVQITKKDWLVMVWKRG